MSGSSPPERSRPTGTAWNQASASSTDRSTTAPMFVPAISTDRLSGFSRRPPQAVQGISTMNSSSELRTESLEVSR